MKIIRNKKGFEMTMQTVIKIVLLLILLAVIVAFLVWGKDWLANVSIPGF